MKNSTKQIDTAQTIHVSTDGKRSGFVPSVWNSIFGMGKKAAGRQVLCTHRRVTPALGARLLRSYVPLRYGPSESGCASNTYLPADTLLVRKFRLYSAIYLHAASAATAPSAAAVVSCLTSFVRQSPAAKIPGQEVMQSSAASMNPLPSSFTTSAKSSF